MNHYDVVAAVVLNNNKILCVQKGATKYPYTSMKFEFPGGKIEPGETPMQALKRELDEELSYNVTIDSKLITIKHTYPDFSIDMTAFICHSNNADNFTLNEHISYQWLSKEDLRSVDWAAADIKIIEALLK